MSKRVLQIRQILTILLALAGIGAMIYYIRCDTSCSYLKGDLLGLDLKYLGMIYMMVMTLLAVIKASSFLRALLAAGLGGEVYLLWFQVQAGIFCPYCLAFAGCVAVAFLINYELPTVTGWKKIPYLFGEVRFFSHPRRYPLVLFSLAGFGFVLLTFSGGTLPVYAADGVPGVYGWGEMEIRIYTDYFCPPCRDAEPKIEKFIEEVARKGKGHILFIDTPMHGADTVLYAKYYLYALGATDDGIQTANRIRRVLFEAAGKEIKTENKLADFLKARKINFILRDVMPFFSKYTEYIQADQIKSTPTLIIITPAGKSRYEGAADIIKALEKIRI